MKSLRTEKMAEMQYNPMKIDKFYQNSETLQKAEKYQETTCLKKQY